MSEEPEVIEPTLEERVAALEERMKEAFQENDRQRLEIARLEREKLDLSAASDVSEAVGYLRSAIEKFGPLSDWPKVI